MTSESLSNFSRKKKKKTVFFFRKTVKKTVLSENGLVSTAQTFPGKKNIRLLNRGGVLESTRYTPYTLTLGVGEVPCFQPYPTFSPTSGVRIPVAYRTVMCLRNYFIYVFFYSFVFLIVFHHYARCEFELSNE